MNHLRTYESFWGSEASGVLPICKKTGKILIGLRSDWVDQPFTWGNFGGAIGKGHYGETEEKLSPEVNAEKEFKEETGFSGQVELIPSFVFEKGSFKYYNYIGLVDEEFEMNNDNIEHNEVSEVKWLTLDELLNHEDLHFGLQSLLVNNISQIRSTIDK